MKVLIAGDLCPQNKVADLLDKGEFEYVLGEVKPVLQHVDYSIVNFECPVCTGQEKPIEKKGPNLKCSEKGVEAAKWAGFDCLTLANNHFLDYGAKGVQNTLDTCFKYHMDYVGGGLNLQESCKILYKRIGDKTIAIINCCENEFSIATINTAGSNPLNPIRQYYCIKEAKEIANYVIVIVHGGHEMFQLPSPRMVETYRFFIDAGADAVVNHHQHCYSGYETYQGKPIFYGLGNFCFDKDKTMQRSWYLGFMLYLSFDEDVSFKIIPYSQCEKDAKIKLLEPSTFDEDIAALNQIISNEHLLQDKVSAYYESRTNRYSRIFEPFNNKIYLSFVRRGWLPSSLTEKKKAGILNYVACESHREILTYFLQNIPNN